VGGKSHDKAVADLRDDLHRCLHVRAGLFIVNVAFPDMQRDFAGSGLAELSWVLNGYAIVFAAMLVPAGRLADLYGRKRSFVAGMSLFVLASAACAVAPSAAVLIAARLLQGAGAAILTPSSLGVVLPAFAPQRRSAVIAAWAAVGAVGAAAGPPLGGLLVQGSWRWVFLVNIPLGLISIWYAARWLDESRDPNARGLPDVVGTPCPHDRHWRADPRPCPGPRVGLGHYCHANCVRCHGRRDHDRCRPLGAPPGAGAGTTDPAGA
jgi:MFS family permease